MKIAISTPTQKSYDKLIKIIKKKDCRFSSGQFPKDFSKFWNINYEKTCVDIDDGKIEYASKAWYKDEGYKIISVDNYIKNYL